MTRPSQELNQRCIENPQIGDYWHEMFCIYHIVLDVLANGNLVIAPRDQTVTEYQCFDYKLAHEITKEDHKKLVCYSGKDSFVADVISGNEATVYAALTWKKSGCTYMSLEEWAAHQESHRRPTPDVTVTDESIQTAMNNALTTLLGFESIEALLESVSVEKRLSEHVPTQAKFNHAIALTLGFENVKAMVAAKGKVNKS